MPMERRTPDTPERPRSHGESGEDPFVQWTAATPELLESSSQLVVRVSSLAPDPEQALVMERPLHRNWPHRSFLEIPGVRKSLGRAPLALTARTPSLARPKESQPVPQPRAASDLESISFSGLREEPDPHPHPHLSSDHGSSKVPQDPETAASPLVVSGYSVPRDSMWMCLRRGRSWGACLGVWSWVWALRALQATFAPEDPSLPAPWHKREGSCRGWRGTFAGPATTLPQQPPLQIYVFPPVCSYYQLPRSVDESTMLKCKLDSLIRSGEFDLSQAMAETLAYGGPVLPPTLLRPNFAHLTMPPEHLLRLIQPDGISSSDPF